MLKNREFGEQIKAAVEKRLGEGYEVRLNEVLKNNGHTLHGLTIMEDGENAAPTIYLEDYEDACERGRFGSIEEAAEKVVEVYMKNKECCKGAKDIADIFSNKGRLLEMVFPRVINADRNKELLKTIPHKAFLDLAVMYFCKLNMTGMGYASVTINNEHLERMGITQEELDEAAMENLRREGLAVMSMASVIGEITGQDLPEDTDIPMMVVTNKENMYGAASMLVTDLFKKVCDKMGSDVYVLPSSVHEAIIVPASFEGGAEMIHRMVQEVNATELSAEGFLSDNVYIFRRKTGMMAVA